MRPLLLALALALGACDTASGPGGLGGTYAGTAPLPGDDDGLGLSVTIPATAAGPFVLGAATVRIADATYAVTGSGVFNPPIVRIVIDPFGPDGRLTFDPLEGPLSADGTRISAQSRTQSIILVRE